MITVHHLNDSRSQRILWLLEELELPYELQCYQRDPATRLAPAELQAVHPLGKSPVVVDGDQVMIESGAIVDWLIRRHGNGRLQPSMDTAAYDAYQQWLHYAEGSAMLPLMLPSAPGCSVSSSGPLIGVHRNAAGTIALRIPESSGSRRPSG